MDAYRMTDIHMHIIPGVDDGSFTMDMSMSMSVMAYMQGVHTIFATPHSSAFIHHQELVYRNFEELKKKIESTPLGQRLFLGCEVRCEPVHMQDTLRCLKTGRFPSMNGTRYILTEFNTRVQPEDALQMAEQLQAEGWLPVIAHVERYPALFIDNTISQMMDMGCLLQINAHSLDDEPDEKVKEWSRKLLSEEKVSFLGSDAHRMNHRPPSVERGLAYLYEHCRREYADAVCFANAEKLLRLAV